MGSHDDIDKIIHGGKPSGRRDTVPPPSEESEELTIEQMDGRYAAIRPANKSLIRMHVLLKDGKIRTFQNHFLDVLSTFDGKEFVLLFAGTKHFQVTVKGHGPKFWAIYDYCSTHRWPYLREAIRDFADKDETVITSIEIKDVTPKPES